MPGSREMCDACLAYNETYMRRAIANLGDGTWEAEVLMEDDVTSDEPIRLHARVTVFGRGHHGRRLGIGRPAGQWAQLPGGLHAVDDPLCDKVRAGARPAAKPGV